MADNRFVELILGPSAAKSTLEFAYKSLAASPQQLFALFLRRDPGMEFASAFPIYARRLAGLLLKVPERFNQLEAKEKEKLLYEETVGAFIFTLLPWMPNDAASQEAVGDIVMAFVQTTRPGRGGIELLGAELGRTPAMLRRLISSGHLASRTNKPFFDSLVLENWKTWTAVAGELSEKCDKHQQVTSRKEMIAFIRLFPCDQCSSRSTESQTPLGRANIHGIGNSTSVFENLLGERLGPWKMVISALAVTSLKENVTEDQMSHIRHNLLQLASGEWAQSCLQRAPDREPPYRLPVYMIECSGHAIMWQVDGAFDELYYCTMQVLKVWAICPLKEVNEICYWIAKAQQAYTEDQISACDVDYPTDQMRVVFPSPFHRGPNDCTNFTVTTADPSNKPEKCAIESSPLLGKFFSLTTVLENRHRDALFPVDPSMEEVHIINHFKSTAFILARSGTGKTTCLVYKLVSRYLASRAEGEVPVRQLLLTRSSGLAEKLKVYTQRLIDTRLGTIGGDSVSDEQQKATPGHGEGRTIKDLLSLKEEAFPLVCTFDHFLRLVENSIRLEAIKKGDYVGRISAADFHLVDSTRFELEYWKRFPITLTRRIPKELAFMDIMGVIKGTASMETKLEPLSRGSYCGKRWNLAPNFKSQERDTVYSLYERYEHIKKKRGEIDDADRVMRVLKALENYTELREQVVWLLQEVYVDEVQDQRQIEIELLLTLVPDPRGIHFAGDTAQSISKDSLFRFENAKALFYTKFKDQFPETGQRQSGKSGAVPKLLHLSHNYRSHEGIISVASVIMDLLYGGFPQLVDELSPEVGDHAGPVPILYIGRRLLPALQGANSSSTEVDEEAKALGGPRVILVRDEKMSDQLRPSLDGSILIKTILESKGMEFEDVILYDFFSTSPYKWDYGILEDIFVDYHVTRHNKGSTPRAAPEKVDIVLCSELKHLYVAITRTRGRLWIVESKEPDVRPIVRLFNSVAQKISRRYSGELLRVLRDDDIPDIRELSAQFISAGGAEPNRWRELGFQLMEKKDYSQAAQCFRNSGDQLEETLADAYFERLTAYRLRAANLRDAYIKAFDRACNLFLKAGHVDKAAECQVDAGNLLAAAKLLSRHGKPQDAAWMFVEAGSPKLALREYVRINDYEKILATYFQSQLFTDVAEFFAQFEKQGKLQPIAWMFMEAEPPGTKGKSAEMDGDEEALVSRLCADVAAVFAQLESPPLSKQNCWKQYTRLLCLLLSPGQSSLKQWQNVWKSIGPVVFDELVSTARMFGKLDYLVGMDTIRGRYQDACVLAAKVGLVREAYSLSKRHGVTLPDPELAKVVNYVHAQRLWEQSNIQPGRSGEKVTALESQWQSVAESLAIFSQKGELPDVCSKKTVALDTFLTLQIAKSLPKAPLWDLSNASWDIIDRTVGILRGMSDKRPASPAVLLSLGIYPTNDGKYIALPYSPPAIGPKIDFPLSYYTGDPHSASVRYVLGILDAAVAAVDQGLCQPHVQPTRKTVICGPKVITQGQSAAINSLLKLHQKFAEISGVCSQLRCTVPGNYHWYSWEQRLLQQLTFTSSCEQDLSVLALLQQELSSSAFDGLRCGLQEFLLSAETVVASKEAGVFNVLSEILDRMRSSEILGIEDLWYACCEEEIRCLEWPELAAAYQIVPCLRAVRASTTADDFPGPFIEKMNKLLCRLEDIQDSAESKQLFHSASVLSVYEELVILLLFLSRHAHFVLPNSWIALHPSLRHLAKIPRFDSKRETYWYQCTLARVVIMLCRLMMRVEGGGGGCRSSAADRLARRGVLIICIVIINLQELEPPPVDYHSMLKEAQEVFGLKSLCRHTTKAFWERPLGEFFGALNRQFAASGCYGGKDWLQVVLTNDSTCSTQLPIFRPGFSKPVPWPELGDSDSPEAKAGGFSHSQPGKRKVESSVHLHGQPQLVAGPPAAQRGADRCEVGVD